MKLKIPRAMKKCSIEGKIKFPKKEENLQMRRDPFNFSALNIFAMLSAFVMRQILALKKQWQKKHRK